MNEQLEKIEQPKSITLVHPDEDLFLFARNREELETANARLALWIEEKKAHILANARELEVACAQAQKNKWAVKPLRTQLNLRMREWNYYDKLSKVVDAGYTLVPSPWNTEVFAIRVKRKKATHRVDSSTYSADIPDQRTDSPPAGEGRYVSEQSVGELYTRELKDSKGKDVTHYYAESLEFADVAFPVIAAKPALMNAAAQAMSLKVFDELGIAPSASGRDPLMLGVVKGPNGREQSFIIAWYVDVRGL